MRKFLGIILLLLSFLLLNTSFVFATDDFSSNYEVVFEAKPNSSMIVSQNISIINHLSEVYITSYAITMDKITPKNIIISDSFGPITPILKTDNNKTIITINFHRPVVGKQKVLNLKISYETADLIHKSGQIWEISIPKISDDNKIDNYNLTLKVPISFGKPAFLSPTPLNKTADNNFHYITYTKNQLVNTGVIGAFGDFQILDFSLLYHVNNPSDRQSSTLVAFPPDTAYQKMYYSAINPLPTNITQDEDGNWIGSYLVPPKTKLDITAKGQTRLFIQPNSNNYFENNEISKNIYLSTSQFWEVDNQQIKDLAKNLRTPKNIFDYVVNLLDYDYQRVRPGAERLGAVKALQNPKNAICTEFSDLFISLSRAAGIPSREIEGYAYTDNLAIKPLSLVQDVLHSWPEYWDKEQQIWKQVDPTWQKTTGGIDFFNKTDFDHFAFVIHGKSSTLPIPAGGPIDITFGTYKEFEDSTVQVIFNFPQTFYSEKKVSGSINIRNLSGQAIYDKNIKISSDYLKIAASDTIKISVIPPFGIKEIPITITAPKPSSDGEGILNVEFNNQYFEYKMKNTSLLLLVTNFILVAVTVLTLLFVVIKIYQKLIKSDKIR